MPADRLMAQAVKMREERPWQFYYFEREDLLKWLNKLADELDTLRAAPAPAVSGTKTTDEAPPTFAPALGTRMLTIDGSGLPQHLIDKTQRYVRLEDFENGYGAWNQDIERIAAFCEQTALDGVLPSLTWFAETAATLRGKKQ